MSVRACEGGVYLSPGLTAKRPPVGGTRLGEKKERFRLWRVGLKRKTAVPGKGRENETKTNQKHLTKRGSIPRGLRGENT